MSSLQYEATQSDMPRARGVFNLRRHRQQQLFINNQLAALALRPWEASRRATLIDVLRGFGRGGGGCFSSWFAFAFSRGRWRTLTSDPHPGPAACPHQTMRHQISLHLHLIIAWCNMAAACVCLNHVCLDVDLYKGQGCLYLKLFYIQKCLDPIKMSVKLYNFVRGIPAGYTLLQHNEALSR
jgi:hypothetical protein